ncbi:NUDIX hydrolase [Corallococcus macrosporus]|uniref:NUDIX hydrolase n=1 Tax=Corallococcus macrosporus DSM 14697 TaxID=1189310 RepID=A0A250JUN7_9BACT|nr:NUDIX hydrolase [Corallococcus macrosporus]ATB47207.1 NUDIX hydrolase [Corallococcus macrosporus DSM 14697]
MRIPHALSLGAAALLALSAQAAAPSRPSPTLPPGYWPEAKVAEVLAKTQEVRLSPDLSRLTADEQAAVKDLLEVGAIFQGLYETSRHHQARPAHAKLQALDKKLGGPKRTQDLLTLYRLYQGPIASTLSNAREAFLPVDAQVAARNVYPVDVTRAEVDAFLAANPGERAALLSEKTVVRRATAANLRQDVKVLQAYPVLDTLHPGLREALQAKAKRPDARVLYAVPYAVAYGPELVKAYGLVMRAARRLEASDVELARYLRNRARDLLSNDYESGDAAWVTGRFQKLNVQLGAYETYDDALFGVKAFHSLSVLLRNEEATQELRKRLGGLQAVEDALPYAAKKRVREDIPVGVYEVIADFGQSRGTNTASILPNDALTARRYGRTILLRENIMRNPDLFASDERIWRAAVADAHARELVSEGNFQRTLWHEVGHYLGPDRDAKGRNLDDALEDYAGAVEEMKADLVSLFSLHAFHKKGTLDAAGLRAVQASGIRRTLQNVRPREDQPYQRMQLVQFNWFLEHGLIRADPQTARLSIQYDKYPAVVTALLEKVLALQHGGDKAATAAFFQRWSAWTPELHEKLAARIRDAQGARFRLVRYDALGD